MTDKDINTALELSALGLFIVEVDRKRQNKTIKEKPHLMGENTACTVTS